MPVVGVLYAGDVRDPAAWSGIPRGLSDGLAACGADVRGLDVSLPPRAERLAPRARVPERALARARTAVAQRRLAAHGAALDAVVQIGTEYVPRTTVPTATYEDMTVVQHERHGDEWFMTTYSERERAAWRDRQRAAYANATVCCVMTQWAADSVVGDYGVAAEKVRVTGVGANHVVDPPAERDWSAPRFLVIARDWRRKNVPLVVETFARLRTERPDATLDVVGPYPGEGGAGVTLHGPLDLRDAAQRARVEALFRQATCYVMPSTHEAAGIAYVEAGRAGLPAIGTTVGGVADLIGAGGMVVDPTDAAALFDAMLRLSDPGVAADLGARARTHSEWYTWPATARRILDALGVS